MYSLERLSVSPESVLDEIQDFAGVSGDISYYDAYVQSGTDHKMMNSLSIDECRWQFRAREDSIQVTTDIRESILSRYGASNEALASIIPLEF